MYDPGRPRQTNQYTIVNLSTKPLILMNTFRNIIGTRISVSLTSDHILVSWICDTRSRWKDIRVSVSSGFLEMNGIKSTVDPWSHDADDNLNRLTSG